MRKTWLAIPAAACLAAGVAAAAATAASTSTAGTLYGCVTSGQRLVNVNTASPEACPSGGYPVSWAAGVPGPSPSPTPTSTSPSPTPTATSPSPSPTATSPSPTPTSPSPTGTGSACTASGPGGVCGPYAYPGITNSNGYNTYTENNCWGDPSCNYQLTSTDPGNWSVTGTEPAGNTAVMTYPNVQQLFSDWTGAGWNGPGTAADTPISGLASLTSTFAESMPHGSGTIAEWGYDLWTNYSSDIMIWTDNVNRGTGGATQIGTATIGGQAFTVYQYGGAGGEIIFSLDGPGGTGTFAQESSGTVDILGVLNWVQSHGYAAGITISQIDAGWEICSTGGVPQTFTVSSYSITGA